MLELVLLSQAIGWSYVFCWSISFYPSLLLNVRTRSVEGTSVDFSILNNIGYFAYATALCLQYYNGEVREQYSQRHTLPTDSEPRYPLVRFNDIAYALHGVVLCLVGLVQIYLLGYKKSVNQHMSTSAQVIIVFVSVILFRCISGYINGTLMLLDVTLWLGNIKLAMSLIKYIPQLLWNRSRKSTQGFSVHSILLDTLGGTLSFGQLFLDGYIEDGTVSGVFDNTIKLALAINTLVFDVLFLIQHYYLYPHEQILPHEENEKAV